MIEQAPVSRHPLSIEEAFLYTITCTHNNKHDWRFPTTIETDSKSSWRFPKDANNNDNWTLFYWNWYNSTYYLCIPVRTTND